MATQIQYRRGTDTQNDAFTGALGEITVDTTNKTLRVHDGATQGGSNIATVSYVDAEIGGIQANAITFGSTSMSIASSNANIVASVAGTDTMTIGAGEVGVGVTPTEAIFTIVGAKSASSWTTDGVGLRISQATYTDTSTATSGTAATNHIHTVALPTIAATNGGVTTTNAATLYVAGAPVEGSNMTITNPYSLYVAQDESYFGGNITVNDSITTTNDVTVGGNLTVNGTTTTLNSTTLTVDDLNIVVASGAGSAGAANGAGLTIDGADASITYNSSANTFVFSHTLSGSGASLNNLNGSNIATGTIPDARIQASGVTQHQASLSITESQISDLGSYITASSSDTLTNKSIAASQLTGTIADARIASSSITQHQTSITAVGTLSTATITTLSTSAITKTGSTGVGNIGQSDNTFNTVFAKATSAQYADLAEKYEADNEYAPGTVLVIGGEKEVTQCNKYADSSAAGVASTNPAHLMNSELTAEYTVDLALTGRVPCRVVGAISKGDLLTTSEIEGTATRLVPSSFVPGCVIGKSLENYNSDEVGVIEILVGKV